MARPFPDLLDTTLRDGSYAINFKFTARDTAVISSRLERAGVRFIEIGHGVGLNASNCGKGRAAESDESYLRAASSSLRTAKFGMFCIPGIARLRDVDLCADQGAGFIRIGTNVGELKSAEKYIALAKKRGLWVSSNLMKSYTMSPEAFAQLARRVEQFGADLLCVVDSAGGMLPEEVESYFRAVRAVSAIPLGFHGHNNLGLAAANSLRAVDLGASLIDASLQGIGRSAGNTPTELFLLAMERKGRSLGIDFFEVMDIGETHIRPLMASGGFDSLDMICGYARFHTSYMSVIREFSRKYQIDPRRLIIGVGERDRLNAPRALVERVARRIRSEFDQVRPDKFNLDRYHGAEQSGAAPRFPGTSRRIRSWRPTPSKFSAEV